MTKHNALAEAQLKAQRDLQSAQFQHNLRLQKDQNRRSGEYRFLTIAIIAWGIVAALLFWAIEGKGAIL